MRIVVDDVAASNGGALSILKDFDEYIKKQDTTNEWIYLLSDKYVEDRKNVKVMCFPEAKRGWLHRLIFDIFKTKKIVNELKPDVFLSLQNTMPFGIKVHKLLYVHQPLPFQKTKKFSLFKKNERYYAIYQYFIGFIIKASIKTADKIIVQTEWMKVAVESIVKKHNVVKITPDVETKYTDAYSFDEVHFFYPTSDAIYKNIKLIEEACLILDKKNLQYMVDITVDKKNSSSKKVVSNKINFLGKIDRLEVFKRYRSSVLVFPSYIETFGYPLVEARKCGSYILASDCDFSHELLDDYANVSFFDPFSACDLAGLMEKVITENVDYHARPLTEETIKHDGWMELYQTVLGDLETHSLCFCKI